MSISAGSRLGVYEILSVIGEGGMGRVYRARDSKLQRQVAIKVLPEGVASDPERVARFEREARTLAALNHPHIAQISANGGSVTTLTTVKSNERSHRWPQVLPDSRHVLFTIQLKEQLFDGAIIAAVPIGGGEPRVVLEGGAAAKYIASGHLIYGKAGHLLATEFDPVAVRAGGAAITVIDNVRTDSLSGGLPVAVSEAGSLVYVPGVDITTSMALLTANRAGQTRPLLDRRVFNNSFRVSPDGKRVAVSINDGQVDLWIVELDTCGQRRFTLGGGSAFPVWSPDASRLYYLSRTGFSRTVSKTVDINGDEDELLSTALVPQTISPDGAIIAGRLLTRTTSSVDVTAVDVRTKKPISVAATAANESEPAFSPDGKYVAYQSDESGRTEIYVQAYPSGNRWPVTTGGGSSRDGPRVAASSCIAIAPRSMRLRPRCSRFRSRRRSRCSAFPTCLGSTCRGRHALRDRAVRGEPRRGQCRPDHGMVRGVESQDASVALKCYPR